MANVNLFDLVDVSVNLENPLKEMVMCCFTTWCLVFKG